MRLTRLPVRRRARRRRGFASRRGSLRHGRFEARMAVWDCPERREPAEAAGENNLAALVIRRGDQFGAITFAPITLTYCFKTVFMVKVVPCHL
jgi:hypothetical protein